MRFSTYPTIFFVFCFIAFGCNSVKNKVEEQIPKENQEEIFACNVEKTDSLRKTYLETNQKDILFTGVDAQSDEYSHSGQYSIKLYPGRPYGLTTVLKGIKPDDYIQITVWRKCENNNGVIAFDGGKGFYTAGKDIIQDEGNGWEKIFLEYFVPPDFYNDSAKIYVWINSRDTIYFDDFEISKRKDKVYPEYSDLQKLQIYLDSPDMNNLELKRETAFRTGILMNSDEDYLNSFLFDGNNFLNAELRLKGDLVDHLLGRKWSFRIKLKDEFTWKHLRTFSIQNPLTRYFLNEWLAHQIFDEEDILTTRYGFVPVIMNEKSLGIYAYEEHFEKQLLESRNRREGPIIRYNEDIFWKRNQESNVAKKIWDIDYFSAAKIIPFKEGRTTNDSLMLLQFEEAQKMLYQYKNREKPLADIFDVDKLARYYALIDLTQAYHGFTWHNLRFYYNPVTCLLEHVAFDGYIENGIYKRFDEPVSGLVDPAKLASLPKEELMLFQVFCDSVFNVKYVNYLKKFSDREFIDELENKYRNEADSLAELLRQEFPSYKFSFNYIRNQAAFIQNNLQAISSNLAKVGDAVKQIKNESFKHGYTEEINRNLVPYQVHAFFDAEKDTLEVLNFTNSEIKVESVILKNQFQIEFEKENILAPFNGINESKLTLHLSGEPERLLFSSGNETYETEISNWKSPKGNTERQKLSETVPLENFLIVDGKVILEGNYRFNKDVLIPANLELVIKPGTKIDLVENAGFFSFSPLIAEGTEMNPIAIISSDNSANGFNILQPQNHSSLKYVRFSGLGSLRKKGWQTPAAVTFYEADVDMENCTFANNSNCDDALNVVRSKFNVQHCRFENTFADAFDSDFCTGLVADCTFQNIGNDAIDFSGSTVQITGCKMIEINDKAISGGEKSTLTVENCDIENANIGVASKDLSVVKLDKITMQNIVYGLVAFQKKPEYGPAKIEIENLKMKNKISFQKIEEGSTLLLNGETINGREKKLALKLYQ